MTTQSLWPWVRVLAHWSQRMRIAICRGYPILVSLRVCLGGAGLGGWVAHQGGEAPVTCGDGLGCLPFPRSTHVWIVACSTLGVVTVRGQRRWVLALCPQMCTYFSTERVRVTAWGRNEGCDDGALRRDLHRCRTYSEALRGSGWPFEVTR